MFDLEYYRTYKNGSYGRMREPIKNSLRVVITIVFTIPTIAILTPSYSITYSPYSTYAYSIAHSVLYLYTIYIDLYI